MNASYAALIGALELAQHVGDPDWVVVDCRADLVDKDFGRRAYDTAHLPGAFFLDLERELSGPRTAANGRHPLPDPASLAARLTACGIGNHSQVVAYDDASGMFAARLWWLLRWAIVVQRFSTAACRPGWRRACAWRTRRRQRAQPPTRSRCSRIGSIRNTSSSILEVPKSC